MSKKIEAVTFDDFNTLRYSVRETEDIIYPIVRTLKKGKLVFNENDFLKEYFRLDKLYRKTMHETLRESLLDNIVSEVLASFGHRSRFVNEIIRKAVDEGLKTRKTKWYPNATRVLQVLRERGYKLGLISNSHWRFLEGLRREFNMYFDVITLSYEHGYVKPHPLIFLITAGKLKVPVNRCLHVGDDPIADIEGAKKCGMKAAFINRGKKEAKADLQINQLSELLEILRRHFRR